MDIIQTCETIDKWIDSCETVEQLELANEAVEKFLDVSRFPNEKISNQEMEAHKDVLRTIIQYQKEVLEIRPVLTDQTKD